MSKFLLCGTKMPKMNLAFWVTVISTFFLAVSFPFVFLALFLWLNFLSHTVGKETGSFTQRIVEGRALPGNKRQYPVEVIVANMNKPTADHVALLSHRNVITFFHEMGHVFHNLLSRTQFARFHGSRWVLNSALQIGGDLLICLKGSKGLCRGPIANAGKLVRSLPPVVFSEPFCWSW